MEVEEEPLNPRIYSILRLIFALVISFLITSGLDWVLGRWSLHLYVDVANQTLTPFYLVVLFMGTLVGALIAKRFFLSASVAVYLIVSAYAVHTIQRVSENVQNAPTYFEIFSQATISLASGAIIIVLACLVVSKLKRNLY